MAIVRMKDEGEDVGIIRGHVASTVRAHMTFVEKWRWLYRHV